MSTGTPTKVQRYLAQCVEDERRFVERRWDRRVVARIPFAADAVAFVALHARQFSWTLARVFGREKRWSDMAGRNFLEPVTTTRPQARPRILVDVTRSAYFPTATGIQRVVRAFAREAAEAGSACPVVIEGGRVYEAYAHGVKRLEVEDGDILFLLDASWSLLDAVLPVIAEVKRRHGKIVVFFFDMIPMLYPETCQSGVVSGFRNWFDATVPKADAILTNATAVATEIRALAAARAANGGDIAIGVFPLGCEPKVAMRQEPSAAVREACDTTDVFLSVGTIEPRKGHPIVLAAFERLWSRGSTARYVMIGRTGWNMRHFEERVLTHPEFGQRLFWLRGADDADLTYAYEHARGVIMPSIAEGYGLPIIEAAAFDTEVILSDIDVFREVGHHAKTMFFAVADPDDLAAKIAAVAASPSGHHNVPPEVPTWAAVVARATHLIRSPGLYSGRAPAVD